MLSARKIWTGLIIAVVGGLGYAAYASVGAPAAAPAVTTTVVVQRGTVLSSVTATGNASVATQLGLNFQTNGTVTEIDVSTGEYVNAGQVLAKIDPTAAEVGLDNAQASLDNAQATLAKAEQPETPQAQAVAQDQLAQSHQEVVSAESALADEKQSASLQAQTDATTVSNDQLTLLNDTSKLTADSEAEQQDCAGDASSVTGAGTCSQDESAVTADEQAVSQAESALQAAQVTQQSDALHAAQTIGNDETAVTTAQTSYDTQVATNAENSAPATAQTLAQDEAAVATAEGNVTSAQQTLAATALTTPVAGTVSAINGQVGTSSSTSSSSTSSSGTSAFVTVTALSSLQVVAGFAEADAAKIVVGQPATITFNALPNQAFAGRVSEVSINSTVVSNVVTYNVTVSILSPPSALRPGMTANVAVVTAERDNVLTLPTSAVPTSGSTATVSVLQANGKTVSTLITIGLRGDTLVEITSGLTAGEKVVVSRASGVSSGTYVTSTTVARGGFGGVGGLGG